MAYASQLLVAKVVKPDGSIPLTAESDAIRWAADSGAQVINLSLGGLRDPLHPNNDYYSTIEASAVRYAIRKGVVVVAAVGNSDEAPSSPWNYASYPAALPHVIGVSALKQNGDVAGFSNRDPFFNDISAPGVGIFSTFPLALTENRPSCTDQGYSDCGGPDYFNAEGTSFAAPQVSAAAAMLFAVDPALTSSQVAAVLEQSADDVNATNGCSECDGRTRPVQRLRDGSTSRGRWRRCRGRCRRPTSTSRTTTQGRRPRSCGARRSRCPRRSTTTTTRSTSTRSRSVRESG